MSIFDDFGAPQFGLRDAKIAGWNATNDYGTAVDVPSIQMMGTTLGVVAARLEGDDRITASGARANGGRVKIRFGSINLAALEVITGISAVPSGSTPNQQSLLKIPGGTRLPYFGICGQAYAEEGSGDTHVFIPKAKVMSDITIAELQYGQFAIPELEVEIIDDDTYGAIEVIEHETATAIAIPPAQ